MSSLREMLMGSPRHLTEDEVARFLQKVRFGERDECWVWTAGTRKGYGSFRLRGRHVYAHRLVLEAKIGRLLAPGEQALHHCDHPLCVNSDHLFVGTQQDNMDDRDRKGRQARGDAHPMSKLTDSDVRAIRVWSSLGCSFAAIAEAFGIRARHARNIWFGRRRRAAGGNRPGCGEWEGAWR